MMRPSFESIDYSLRPAKHAERKMIVEMLQRLTSFRLLDQYQYIGFGSVWFSDFNLFHRTLNIKKMISIEREVVHRNRFEFNKPFGGIELMFGDSRTELPKIDWSIPSITWLDYDQPLNPDMIDDIKLIAFRAKSGDAFIVTVTASYLPPRRDEEGEGKLVETVDQLKILFSASNVVPSTLVPRQMMPGKPLSSLYQRMIVTALKDALTAVNQAVDDQLKLTFRPISFINYKDGAHMTTVAGVFVNPNDESKYSSCDFESLPFFAESPENAIKVKMPLLTPREMRHIELSLPATVGRELEIGHCPKDEADIFAKFYRYLPSFAHFEP